MGDALGAPVEFMRWQDIQAKYGPEGIRSMDTAYGRVGAITDDTQMMLFTAEGLLRARTRQLSKGFCDIPSVVSHAYIRWLNTQGLHNPELEADTDSWLFDIKELHSRRAPGNTCITALETATYFGERALNDSKGCGGIMRITPVAIAAHCWVAEHESNWAFDLATDLCALTHGHPTGQLPGGFLAALLVKLFDNEVLEVAIQDTISTLKTRTDYGDTLQAVESAVETAKAPLAAEAAIRRLGEGWVAEEALAIGLYSVLSTYSFEEAVIRAVNHSGDSDSTGLIAGSIAGAIYGATDIPDAWLETLELKDQIVEITQDLIRDDRSSQDKYPPC